MGDFLRPLHMDTKTAVALSRELHGTFQRLAADSMEQFLPTPIAESILRPKAGQEKGRYVPKLRFLTIHTYVYLSSKIYKSLYLESIL